MQTANTDTPLRRGRLFIVALMALFTGGAAVSMRAATAVLNALVASLTDVEEAARGVERKAAQLRLRVEAQ